MGWRPVVAKRQDHLVTQHLENISRKALENYEDIIRSYVRRRYGIYALYRGKRLYYVGLASNLLNRLAQHLRDRHADTWDRFSIYLTIGDRHLKELESLILRTASPRGNRTRGRFARSADLRRQFKREIAEHQKAERDSLFRLKQPLDNGGRPDKKNRGVLAKYTKGKSFKIRSTYKGRTYFARVRPDGRIRYGGELYRAPSSAAYKVLGRPADGWFFWRFERAPGDWMPLDELRR
jgi:hypothetical protein